MNRRAIIKNIITEEEAKQLPPLRQLVFLKDGEKNNPVIQKIMKTIIDYARLIWRLEVKVHEKSFCRVDQKREGHVWHVDTGTHNHMLWCTVGATILLSEPTDYEGGEIFYRHDGKVSYLGERSRYDLYMHTSDVEHKVNPHTGERKVFLMFI